MIYYLRTNYNIGSSNYCKFYIEIVNTFHKVGKLRKDGSINTKKRILYGNSRREIIGKLKERIKGLRKISDWCYEKKQEVF